MKKLALSLAILLGITAASCSGNAGSNAAPASTAAASAEQAATINIRYVDMDSVAAHYNLAKDIQDLQLRAISKLQSAQQSRSAEIQRFGQQIEQKMRSNGYLSEDSYNADVAKFNKMQRDAEVQLANMDREAQAELAAQQQQINDSIESFIKAFNATRGYDAILVRASGLYFNPALDITDEVIEGLNARYNKVDSKK